MVRTVMHALASRRIDRVVVSTDDEEIANVALAAGAEIVVRPPGLAGDTASIESAVEHALTGLREGGTVVDTVVVLQCTSPFRSAGQLDAALERFEASGSDSMFSGVLFQGYVWRPGPQGRGYAPAAPEPDRRLRRQEIRDTYLETGSFHIFRSDTFERSGMRLGGVVDVYPVTQRDALQVQDPAGLERARIEAALHGDPELLATDEIKWLVIDVHGTLTDGGLSYGDDDTELVRFDARDGAGIRL